MDFVKFKFTKKCNNDFRFTFFLTLQGDLPIFLPDN